MRHRYSDPPEKVISPAPLDAIAWNRRSLVACRRFVLSHPAYWLVAFLGINPGFDTVGEHVERERSGIKHFVVEGADVEFGP